MKLNLLNRKALASFRPQQTRRLGRQLAAQVRAQTESQSADDSFRRRHVILLSAGSHCCLCLPRPRRRTSSSSPRAEVRFFRRELQVLSCCSADALPVAGQYSVAGGEQLNVRGWILHDLWSLRQTLTHELVPAGGHGRRTGAAARRLRRLRLWQPGQLQEQAGQADRAV